MQDDNNNQVAKKNNKMVVLGCILIGIGILDFAVALVGIDLYGLVGINLPGWLYDNSPAIWGVLGIGLYYTYKTAPEKLAELKSSIEGGEEIIHSQNANLFHSFFKQEMGTFILTSKRIKYSGSHAVNGSPIIGSKDFDILIKDIKDMKKSFFSTKITDSKDNSYKIQIRKKVRNQISELMNRDK